MAESEPTRRPGGIVLGPAVPIKALPDVLESPFPERRTIHWLPPDRVTNEAFSIVVSSEVLLQISRHVAQSLERELGGFLLGNRYRCPNTGREYIIIDQYVAAEYTEGTAVSLTFTHEAWAHFDDRLTGKFYGKQVVGWYHSHPGMSIFLSEHDLIVHQERFADPWKVALVLEPHNHLGGFFAWNGDRIDPNRYCDFYELLDSGDRRESVVAWNNYDGLDPLGGGPPALAAANTAGTEAPHAELGPPPLPPDGTNLPGWLRGNAIWYGAGALAVVLLLLLFWPRTADRKPGPEGSEVAGVGPSATSGGDAGAPMSSPSTTPEPTPTPEELSPEAKRQIAQIEQKDRENKRKQQEREERRRQAIAAEQKRIEDKQKRIKDRQEKDRAAAAQLQNNRNAQIILVNNIAAEMKVLTRDSPEYIAKEKELGSANAKLQTIERDLKRIQQRLPKIPE